ncbi:MAG: iron-sulfur cluster assembly scaffold protein [Candidatus Dependentiae bacterium]|nr:iron-sulfur cluster assembly scaffold protein [Candidatus Dependentiae bacterium]
MNNMNQDLYKQDLIDHSKNPRNYGILDGADFFSDEHNPSCGDSVKICGIIENGKIVEMRFEGSGCVLSMAMASKLTEFVVGMDLHEVAKLDEELVEKLLGTRLGLNRLRCGLLSVMALTKGASQYLEKNRSSASAL